MSMPPPMPPSAPSPAGKPSNNLALAIISTILCCLPLGIVSIVYATKVDGLWMNGQYAEAETAAGNAKKWGIASIVVGVVGAVLYLGFMLLVAAAGVSDSSVSFDSNI